MKTRTSVPAGIIAAMLTAMAASAQQPASPASATVPAMPKQTSRVGNHINRVIDLWLKGQPVYYTQVSGGGYAQGKELAATKADYITYEMEHGPLDFKELREFMRGLVDAGPTRTGHRTPPVIVTLPISGTADRYYAEVMSLATEKSERYFEALGYRIYDKVKTTIFEPEVSDLYVLCVVRDL